MIENPANQRRGLSFILVEPKPYSEYIEKILGEINKRLVDKSNDITDIQRNLVCKCLASKKILFD